MASPSFVEMRSRNAAAILGAVRSRPGISRAELADQCELAKSTVSSIVDELVQSGILYECGSKNVSRGRRPVGLEFNSAARAALGISYDIDRVEVCLSDLSGRVAAVQTVYFTPEADCDELIDAMLEAAQNVLLRAKLERWQVASIGVALPGPLSEVGGTLIAGTSLSCELIRENLAKFVSRSAPCRFDTNTNSAALAESLLGAAQTSPLALVVRLGTEVRSAFLRESELLSGFHGRGGDLGHLSVPGVTAVCRCGKTGCINAVASFDAIVSRARQLNLEAEHIDDVIALALADCRPAMMILEEAAEAVGFGIASAASLLAPADIIVTGRMVAVAEIIVRPLKQSLKKYCFTPNWEDCSIYFSDNALHAEATGAALAALRIYGFWDRLLEQVFAEQSEMPSASRG